MTSPAGQNGSGRCYRHPDRESWVRCQRCGRTVCGECQTQAPVGVHCPECTREARNSAPRTRSRALAVFRRPGAPVVTLGLIAVCVLVFVVMFLTGGTGGAVGSRLLYFPPWTLVEPWRLLTSLVAHAGVLHLLFNMFALYLFGSELEVMLGRWRFAALFLLSGLGGSAAVMLLEPGQAVVGASGAIFGLFGAYFVIARRLGGNASQLLVVIALNLAIGFFVPQISWQAHVGGAITGALVGLILVNTRRRSQIGLQAAGLAAVAVVVGLVLVSRFFLAY